jgi:hypothetical protein
MRSVATVALLTVVATAVVGAGQAARPAGPSQVGALGPYQNIPLWPAGQVPLATGTGPLDQPFLSVFQPPPGRRNGAAVVIAPGGSNIMLMYGGEGFESGEVMNDWGVTAFVLTYRLSPKYNNQARVLDAQRAIRMVRANAAAWGLDPNRIGYAGFSAGGNMGRSAVAAPTSGDPNAPDPVDRISARPDYLVLVYGAGNPTPGEDLKTFPPTFLVSAAGDTGPSLANAQLFMDLTRARAIAEVHIYQQGRHGFGSGFGSSEFAGWMPALQQFLTRGGFLGGQR